MAKAKLSAFWLNIIIFIAAYPAYAEAQAEDFVKLFQAYCVETNSDADLINNFMALEDWEEQPKEVVKIGQAEGGRNARGYMTKKNGQLYLINYSEGAGCGLLTQGAAAPDVLAIVKQAYRISDTVDTEEGFQRTIMMVLSRESRFAGSIIVLAFLPSEPSGVVSLAHLPKELADTIR